MRLGKNTRLAAVAVAVAAGAGVAALSPASPAVAYFSPPLFLDVHVLSPAHLVAKGAAVAVPVDFICTSQRAFLSVTVTERVGKGVAAGFGFEDVGCTNAREQTFVTVVANSNGKAFVAGKALGQASISGCAPTVCGNENDSTTIRISR